MTIYYQVLEGLGDPKTAVYYDDSKKYPSAFGVIPNNIKSITQMFESELNQVKYPLVEKPKESGYATVVKIADKPKEWIGIYWPQTYLTKPNLQKAKDLKTIERELEK